LCEYRSQRDALAAAGCTKVFEDHASGARADRPGLQAALDYLHDGEVLVVWKLDRLGRNLPHLIETVTALEKRGVGFQSLTEAINTTTPGGRLVFHLFAALGQFERDLVQERTRAGLAAAAARGRKGGRKPAGSEEKLRRAREYMAKGLTVREAARRVQVGKTALYNAISGKPPTPAPAFSNHPDSEQAQAHQKRSRAQLNRQKVSAKKSGRPHAKRRGRALLR